jgi:HEAT repeat protein
VTAKEPDGGRAGVLLAKIATETRRSQLDDLLRELQRVPTIPDCTVLLPLTTHRWWQVRWGAIDALAKCRHDPRAEAALLAVLANPVDDYDRINANASLGQCGTKAAIPDLAAQVHHPTEDVKCSAIYALAQIGDETQLPVFLDALTDRSWAAKWYAMQAIARHETSTRSHRCVPASGSSWAARVSASRGPSRN